MRRQPLHESLGGSVMTKRPRGRDQISRDHLSPLVIDCLDRSPQTVTTRLPLRKTSTSQTSLLKSACKARFFDIEASLPHQASKTSLFGKPAGLANVLTQVGRLPRWNLVLLLLVLSLLTQPAMCKPWIDERPDRVTFRSRICQQVSSSELRKRMGPVFDEERMAADMSTARHLVGDDVMSSWAKGTEGYQSDGPAAQLEDDGSSLVEAERYLSSGELFLREEGMMYADNSRVEERDEVDVDLDLDNGRVEEREEIDVDVRAQEAEVEDSSSFEEKRSWLPRRQILHSHRRGRDRDHSRSDVYKRFKTVDSDELGHKNHGVIDSYKYMRRRRRRRSLKTSDFSGALRSQKEDLPRKTKTKNTRNSKRKDSSPANVKQSSKKSSNSFLPLRLILSGKLRNSRKLRKQLKKEFRQQSRKFNKPPPWQCKLSHKAVFMKKNVFPRVLLDGRCGTDKCFYRLYNCEPNKYAIKLLQRDENHCNPLPMVGNSTVYEERWNIITRHITVGCNCASLVGNGKNKNRRKN